MIITIKYLIIDKQNNLKKVRKFEKHLKKILKKYIDFSGDITISYEDITMKGLEFDIRNEFDNHITEEYRKNNGIVINFDKKK